jgi:hypothetical protein
VSRFKIVHPRSSSEPLASLGDRVSASVGPSGSGIEVVTVYCRRGLATDVAARIHDINTQSVGGQSALALRRGNALRAFDLVEHTVWDELL